VISTVFFIVVSLKKCGLGKVEKTSPAIGVQLRDA